MIPPVSRLAFTRLESRHWISVLILCLASAWHCAIAQARVFDATNLRSPTDLGSVWLVHAGDDPAYARQEFDDSHWMQADWHKPLRSSFPKSNPKVIWYRMHVNVTPGLRGLALSEYKLSSAFEIFVNGQRILHSGRVEPFVPYTVAARLLAPIPDAQVATGSLVIALRMHTTLPEWSNRMGLSDARLTLGQHETQSDQIWLTLIGQKALDWMTQLLGLGLGIVALALFLTAQHRQLEYLWIFLLFFIPACALPLTMIEMFHNIPEIWGRIEQTLSISGLLFTTLMYFALLRLRIGRWMRVVLAAAVVGLVVFLVIPPQNGSHLNVWVVLMAFAGILLVFFMIFVSVVIPVLLVVHWWRGNREAGILLIAAFFSSLMVYVAVILSILELIPAMSAWAKRLMDLITAYPAGPFNLNLTFLDELLFALSLTVIIVLRSVRMSRQEALLEAEMAAAREVQQLILPEQVEAVPGFTVESVYQPSKQVGGDFFQIMPDGDGGVLIVVGDVAGKGLPAAMQVSVLVGSIRTAAEDTCDPALILRKLNERLIGRTHGGFATALAAHVTANGAVTIGNAGHLSPYLDGREIELPSALPLGIVSGASYETIRLHLPPGSRLTFYSDGVIEAQNQKGELFGFERGKAISTQPAAQIVKAAQGFGQTDDITVLVIQREALEPAATSDELIHQQRVIPATA